MGGADTPSMIGRTDPTSERRAQQLARGLETADRGRREYALHALGALWWPNHSCMKPSKGHALPTRELLARVATHVNQEQEETTRIAALVALRKAWKAYEIMESNRPAESAAWKRPSETIAAVGAALGDRSRLVRIVASAALAEVPCAELISELRSALQDEVWAVRYNAIIALAALAPDESLVDALRRSQPSTTHTGFGDAVLALRRRGFSVPGDS